MNITLQDLVIAYRKAKVDMFYASNASLQAIGEYEHRLIDNLTSLQSRLRQKNQAWISEDGFLGGWTLAPKDVKSPHRHDSDIIFSSPAANWQHTSQGQGKPTATFRLMSDVSIDFHVLSALWILKVGHVFDKKLQKSSYGNRLRRTQTGSFSEYSLGSFNPYLRHFRAWRENGISAMRTALDAEKRVVALTTDVRSFYHEVNPDFLIRDDFMQATGVRLGRKQIELNRVFVDALKAWGDTTPLGMGLPVGLPASGLVANIALIDLDHMITSEILPLYYGRYVDDILLVLEDGAMFDSATSVWQWLIERSGGLLGWVDQERSVVEFKPTYLAEGRSRIRFDVSKTSRKSKAFILEGDSGVALLDSLMRQITAGASEWRALPNLPASANSVRTDIVVAIQGDGEASDNLRKTAALTMRRAGFAIKLRDIEAHTRHIPPDSWAPHRHAFLDSVIEHVLTLPHFFDLAQYLTRVVRVATICEDFRHLTRIAEALERVVGHVASNCTTAIQACPEANGPAHAEIIDKWRLRLSQELTEGIISAFPARLTPAGARGWQAYVRKSRLRPPPAVEVQSKQAHLFAHDLAHVPFRALYLSSDVADDRTIPSKEQALVIVPNMLTALIPARVMHGMRTLANWIGHSDLPSHGLLFATRPFDPAELHLVSDDLLEGSKQGEFRSVVLALRGFTFRHKTPHFDEDKILKVSSGRTRPRSKVNVAVASWQTDPDSWVASVSQSPDPDLGRYRRITQLINDLMSTTNNVHYLVLPELSMPAKWFMTIAKKLSRRNVSLITGIEYQHTRGGEVRNQIWASLTDSSMGFPSTLVYRQDKQAPALHEEAELHRIANKVLLPGRLWKTPPILDHDGLMFALLTCSELTNIKYRAALSGNVDALFVLEWNKDVDTFVSLVESAALDVHAYIVQCNDRAYGDSRIRAPYKDSWRRDVLRVKGGIEDYIVTGTIDPEELRRFQSNHRSPSRPFKPVPDGFKVSGRRRRMPAPSP